MLRIRKRKLTVDDVESLYLQYAIEHGATVYWVCCNWGDQDLEDTILDLYKVDGKYVLTGTGGDPLFEGESPEADKEIRRFRRLKAMRIKDIPYRYR
jgi:hypothetical protein